MNKNILALGLIAVISGISTAQTYTATAGTNGVTDIQSDYSMSTGDGASVSVDVPLEFELPKKVAIALNMGSGLPASPMFEGISHIHDAGTGTATNARFSTIWDGSSRDSLNRHTSGGWIGVTGGLYANAPVAITIDTSDFVHESDPNSIVKPWNGFQLGKADNGHVEYANYVDDGDFNTSRFPHTINVSDSTLIAEGNKLSFLIYYYPYTDTIDPTDRAGKYISTATITVSTL